MIFGGGLTAGLLGEIGRAIHSQRLQDIAHLAWWVFPFDALYEDALHRLTVDTTGFAEFVLTSVRLAARTRRVRRCSYGRSDICSSWARQRSPRSRCGICRTHAVRFRPGARLDPSQVEDRRGRGGPIALGGGGLGVAGVVVYLLFALLGGGGAGTFDGLDGIIVGPGTGSVGRRSSTARAAPTRTSDRIAGSSGTSTASRRTGAAGSGRTGSSTSRRTPSSSRVRRRRTAAARRRRMSARSTARPTGTSTSISGSTRSCTTASAHRAARSRRRT